MIAGRASLLLFIDLWITTARTLFSKAWMYPGLMLPLVIGKRWLMRAPIIEPVDGRKTQLPDFVSPTMMASFTALSRMAAQIKVFINLVRVPIDSSSLLILLL